MAISKRVDYGNLTLCGLSLLQDCNCVIFEERVKVVRVVKEEEEDGRRW